MKIKETISKLNESIQNNYGDPGRTLYIIEKLEKNRNLPKSDLAYIERIVKLCTLVFEESSPEKTVENIVLEDLIKCYHCDTEINLDEKSIRKNNFWFHDKCFEESSPEKTVENIVLEDLIKCYHCDTEINLDEKSIRKNNFWFHDKCFEKIPIIKTNNLQKIEPIKKEIKQPSRIIKTKTTIPQMVFSGGLLASLVGTTYFWAGEVISLVVGVCGTALYFATFKPQIVSKKRKNAEFVKTGIPGFDSTLSVGLKKNSSVVVSGPPGSGKTTFGLQFIYSGAKEFEENGIYISLSQSIEEIKNDCKTFGWDIDELVSKGKILMIDLRPFKIKDEVVGRDDSLYRGEQIPFEHLTKFILNSIKKIKAKRIVIDSISILGMQYSDKFYMRQGLQGMIQSLENFGVTSLLISEFSEKDEVPLEWFVTSGIIQLDNQIINNEMKRTIKIIKLRGIEHSEQVHSIELGSNGLYVYED
ncbi:RAD55 family ATPase [Nitrosopumilus oxyclinae]|nr:ATPase domain-containing protein [Nitrosopumilus oxyclinae]